MRLVPASLVLALAACGASASVTSPHEAEVVGVTPVSHAIAASTIFIGCPVERAEEAQCRACDVTLHDTDEGGLVAYASHWNHKLKPWDGHEGLKVTVSGELADTKFEASVQDAATATELFGEAEAWCAERVSGSYYLLKNDIDTEFGGAE